MKNQTKVHALLWGRCSKGMKQIGGQDQAIKAAEDKQFELQFQKTIKYKECAMVVSMQNQTKEGSCTTLGQMLQGDEANWRPGKTSRLRHPRVQLIC
jgi:hypothetical protein